MLRLDDIDAHLALKFAMFDNKRSDLLLIVFVHRIKTQGQRTFSSVCVVLICDVVVCYIIVNPCDLRSN